MTGHQRRWPVLLLFRLLNRNVAIAHHALMVALQEERAGLALIAIERAASGAGNLHVVVNLHAVAQHRQIPSHESDVEAGPLAQLIADVAGGSEMSVDRAHFV